MLPDNVKENVQAAYPAVAQALTVLEEVGFLEHLRNNAVIQLPSSDSPNYSDEVLVQSGRSLGYREVFNAFISLIAVEPEKQKRSTLKPSFGAARILKDKGLIQEDTDERPKPNLSARNATQPKRT